MTWLEKFHAEHKTLSQGYIMAEYCPDDKLVHMVCETTDGQPDCVRCWMRQVPESGESVEGPDRT